MKQDRYIDLEDPLKREEQYRVLAEAVPVGIWQVHEDGRTAFANPLLLAFLGLAPDEMNDADIPGLLGHGRAGFPGIADRFEAELKPARGHARHVLITSSGWLKLAGDGPRSALISVSDISQLDQLKRANDEVVRLNRELAAHVEQLKEARYEIVRRNRMTQLGQLTATVAHEIRNPLGAVQTAAFIIDRKTKGKGIGIEAQLQRIANGLSRCDAIITQLLDFSRSKQLQTEELALDQWLTGMVAEAAQKLPPAVEIAFSLGLGARRVPFDPRRLAGALVNLLTNASEAMVGKGDDASKFTTPTPRIVVETRQTRRGAEISVADNGPGISEEHLHKVLEPLFTTKNFGTGLGLPAVEKILLEHGGGLDIASTPGQGARFTVWIPFAITGQEAA